MYAMNGGFRWMIPVATAGSMIAIASAWLYYNAVHQDGSSGTYIPFLAAVTAAGGLTSTSIYLIAPDNQRSRLGAFVGGLLAAIVAAAVLLAMIISAFGS